MKCKYPNCINYDPTATYYCCNGCAWDHGDQKRLKMEEVEMKVTQQMLDEELHTFCSRTEKQLIIRTRMIFDPVRLKATETVADWLGLADVKKLASKKLDSVVH